jgi:hypothetical protein
MNGDKKDCENKRVNSVKCAKIAHNKHASESKLYAMFLISNKNTQKFFAIIRGACVKHASKHQTRYFSYLLYVGLFSTPSKFFPYIREKEKSVFIRGACFCAFLRKIPTFGKVEVAHA